MGAVFRRDVQRFRDPWASEDLPLPPWWHDIPVVLRRTELWAIAEYRFAQWARSGSRMQALALAPVLAVLHVLAEIASGSVISHHARIGPGLYIAHGQGVVIGAGASIGQRCDLYQGATLGMDRTGKFPSLGDRVLVATHAVLIGAITVGDHAHIGPNTVVRTDVPSHAVVLPAEPTVRSVTVR